MARQILRELISPIKTTEFFSIMADETTDASNTEQLVLCVRWVDASLVAHEDLIGMYELKNIEANTITEAIKDALLLLDLPLTKLRGQCYDMAASMAGSKSGVAKQLQTLQPKAIYVHCYGHALNLACSDSIRRCKLLRDALDIAREMTKLIKESPRREAIFKDLKDTKELDQASPGIRVLCPTRWTIKADTFLCLLRNYETLMQTWEESLNYVRDVEMRGRIRGVATYMCRFDFFFGCLLSEKLLRYSDNLARSLQAPSLSASDGHKMAMATLKALDSLRNEQCFDQFYIDATDKAKNLNVDDPVLPRQRRPPKKLDSGSTPFQFESCHDMYKSIYFEALDLLCAGIRSRFDQPGYRTYSNLENLLVKCCKGEEYDDEFRAVTELYGADLRSADLLCQLTMLRENLLPNFSPTIPALVDYLVEHPYLYHEVAQIARLILVLPATNATSERSFSALKRIKTALRSTMGQTRMNHLLLLHVHKDKTDALNAEDIGEEFVGSSEHRIGIFGKFK